MRRVINSQEELDKIAVELKKIRANPVKYAPTKAEKETTKQSHEIYNRVLAQVLNENKWTNLCT